MSKRTNLGNLDFGTYIETNKKEFSSLLLAVSDPHAYQTQDEPMMFALDCALILLSAGKGKKPENEEQDVVFRGLVHKSAFIRAKAIYTASVLLHTAPEITFGIIEKLIENIAEDRSALSLLERVFPHLSKSTNVHPDSFLSLVIISLSERFDDPKLIEISKKIFNEFSSSKVPAKKKSPERLNRALEIGYALSKTTLPIWVKVILLFPYVEFVFLKMLSFFTPFLLKTITPDGIFSYVVKDKVTKFLVKAYSEKRYPCNALEMTLFLAGHGETPSTISKEIAKLYRNHNLKDEDEARILGLCTSSKNGITAWYIYTLIPYYMTKDDKQQKKTITLIKNIYEQSLPVSRYIAISSMWVITKFLSKELAPEILNTVELLYERCCQEFIEKHGAWIKFTHDEKVTVDSKKLDPNKLDNIIKLINNYHINGCRATRENSIITSIYDNGIIIKYGEYLGPKGRLSEITDTLEKAIRNPSKDDHFSTDLFLKCSIDSLGRIGENFPDEVVQVLSKFSYYVEGNNTKKFGKIDHDTFRNSVANALAKIGRVHPMKVIPKIIAFPNHWQNTLNDKILSPLSNEESAPLTYAGEALYQRLLLIDTARKEFANGIEKSGSTRTLNDFFGAYSDELLKWVLEKRSDHSLKACDEAVSNSSGQKHAKM